MILQQKIESNTTLDILTISIEYYERKLPFHIELSHPYQVGLKSELKVLLMQTFLLQDLLLKYSFFIQEPT